jgi:multidrug efflux pump
VARRRSPAPCSNATISAQSRLQTTEQFGEITLKTASDGSIVRLRDVARLELGAESYDTVARYNGKPAVGIASRLANGANQLDTAAAVKASLADMEKAFPAGMKQSVPYDTAPFVQISIEEVVVTLLEAIALVFVVMFVFLQNWRATIIPTIAVPVVLLGTFGVLALLGFSINTLTLFGLVLAIGLLVDDAIVVVENVERVMAEQGLSPVEATRKSMNEITGALVGIALVLSAVFVPMAFFGGWHRRPLPDRRARPVARLHRELAGRPRLERRVPLQPRAAHPVELPEHAPGQDPHRAVDGASGSGAGHLRRRLARRA